MTDRDGLKIVAQLTATGLQRMEPRLVYSELFMIIGAINKPQRHPPYVCVRLATQGCVGMPVIALVHYCSSLYILQQRQPKMRVRTSGEWRTRCLQWARNHIVKERTMRGRLVAGKFLLVNESAARRWIKKTFGWLDEAMPQYYPCLATAPLGADENAYPHYEYLIDVENMLDALLEAKESVPTDKQQPYAVRYAHSQSRTSA